MARTAAVGASALAVAGAGCGGSGGLSTSELVSQVDAICKRHNEVITAAASKALAGGQPPQPEGVRPARGADDRPRVLAAGRRARRARAGRRAGERLRPVDGGFAGDAAKLEAEPAIIADGARFKGVNGQGDALGFASDCHVGPSP